MVELEGKQIVNSDTLLYLGIRLDRGLTWKVHIDLLVSKAAAAVNVLRMLGRVSGGTNPETLLMVHSGLIRAILEWGGILIAGVAKKYLKKLDTVKYASLRAVLGCMKTTPIPILLSESREVTLSHRRDILLNRNAVRINSWRSKPLAPRIKLRNEKLKRTSNILSTLRNFR